MSENKEGSAILLQINKTAQINALKELGFNVDENLPLSKISDYTKCANGLLDIQVATINKIDGKQYFFTQTEWAAMTTSTRSAYNKIGIRVRAEKKDFIIAHSNCTTTDGATTFKFGGYGTNFKNVTYFGPNSSGLYDYDNGLADSKAMHDQQAGITDSQGIVGTPAIDAALNFKAFTGDTTQWYLPSLSISHIMLKYRQEIDSFFTKMFSSSNCFTSSSWYWSSTVYDVNSSWYVYYGGGVSGSSRNFSVCVRAVCVVEPSASV